MTLTILDNLVQGSDEWLQARCGLLTASTIGQLITTKTLRVASNDTSRALTLNLVAERITGRIDPIPVTRDMERGMLDEPIARALYAQTIGSPVMETGLMVVTTEDGNRLGYSPDGLVGTDGLIEIKSRRPKKHIQTVLADEVPVENMAQIQTGLLVSGRDWCDYVSFCSGLPLYVKRVHPDPEWRAAITEAWQTFEDNAATILDHWQNLTKDMPPTDYIDHFQEIEL